MENRVPTYPGRVTLTPVTGQTNTYDLVRADEPTEAGTPLNKATLLSDDAVTALTGAGLTLDEDTPSGAFEAIAGVIGEFAPASVEVVSYTGTGTFGSSNPCSVTFSFKPAIIWLFAIKNGNTIQDVHGSSSSRTNNKRTIIPVDAVNASYTSGQGLYLNESSDTTNNYGKFDSATNTYSWYTTDAADKQYNRSDYVYYVLGIKGARE